MTPAVSALVRAGVLHEVRSYEVTDGDASYGERAAAALGVAPALMLKTLVVRLTGGARGGRLGVGILAVATTLDPKALAVALGAKNADLASPADAERATGYVTGGISPLRHRSRLPVAVDAGVLGHDRVWVSAGRRGLAVAVAPADLVRLTSAVVHPLARAG